MERRRPGNEATLHRKRPGNEAKNTATAGARAASSGPGSLRTHAHYNLLLFVTKHPVYIHPELLDRAQLTVTFRANLLQVLRSIITQSVQYMTCAEKFKIRAVCVCLN